jgi:hypothetical protein
VANSMRHCAHRDRTITVFAIALDTPVFWKHFWFISIRPSFVHSRARDSLPYMKYEKDIQ